jgi:FtsZ-interacting cell division protein ZipA
LHGGEDRVVAAAWTPADFLVGLEVFFGVNRQRGRGHIQSLLEKPPCDNVKINRARLKNRRPLQSQLHQQSQRRPAKDGRRKIRNKVKNKVKNARLKTKRPLQIQKQVQKKTQKQFNSQEPARRRRYNCKVNCAHLKVAATNSTSTAGGLRTAALKD